MNNQKFTKPGPDEHDKTLYKNGCACVRWRKTEKYLDDGYLVYFSPDDNFGSSNKGGRLIAKIGISDYDNGNGDYERAFTQAKALCDLWRVPPEKMLDGKPVVYDKGCACVVRNDFWGRYEIRVKNWKETKYLDDRIYELDEDFIHGEKSEEETLARAMEKCNEISGRNEMSTIKQKFYPDLDGMISFFCGALGLVVFFLFWIGVSRKSSVFSNIPNDCILWFPFSNEGLDLFSSYWWQTTLLILLSASLGTLFWGLSLVRRFSPIYRLFVGAFGKTQTVLTAVSWGLVALYWAAIGLWRSIISPVPDALGYPHFIVATIYLAVIVWGIVDFMKHRMRFPINFTANNIGAIL